MRPAGLLAALFAILALFASFIALAFGWAVINADNMKDLQLSVLLGAAGSILFLLAILGAWATLHIRLVRPIESLTRQIETLARAGKVSRINVPDGHLMGGLPDAVQELIARFIASRREREEAIDTTVPTGRARRRHSARGTKKSQAAK